jgi:tripeptidyl-peptidase I
LTQGQFANIADLETFYADQVPAAVGSNFTFVSVDGKFMKTKLTIVIFLMFFEGGTNPQTPADAGVEANLDTQFGFGLSHPIPVRIYALYENFLI